MGAKQGTIASAQLAKQGTIASAQLVKQGSIASAHGAKRAAVATKDAALATPGAARNAAKATATAAGQAGNASKAAAAKAAEKSKAAAAKAKEKAVPGVLAAWFDRAMAAVGEASKRIKARATGKHDRRAQRFADAVRRQLLESEELPDTDSDAEEAPTKADIVRAKIDEDEEQKRQDALIARFNGL